MFKLFFIQLWTVLIYIAKDRVAETEPAVHNVPIVALFFKY